MSGMSADTAPDDLLGLIKALKDDPQHDTILFHFTDRFFMPPEDPLEIVPVLASMGRIGETLEEMAAFGKKAVRELIENGARDEDLIDHALRHKQEFYARLLHKATLFTGFGFDGLSTLRLAARSLQRLQPATAVIIPCWLFYLKPPSCFTAGCVAEIPVQPEVS